VNAKNGARTDEVIIKEQVKVHRQWVSVATSVHKNWYIVCSKKSDYSKDEYCIR
jgi:hypothetical protein